MGVTNQNLVKLYNQLESIRKEVEVRTASCKGDDGVSIDPDLFRIRNPDITHTLGEWSTMRADEAVELEKQIADLSKHEKSMGTFERLTQQSRQSANGLPVATASGVRVSDRLSKGIMEHADYKEFKARRREQVNFNVGINMKALFDTSESQGQNVDRSDRVVAAPWRRLSIFDVIPEIQQDQPGVEYLSEDSPTTPESTYLEGAPGAPADMGIAEGAAYPDTAISYVEVSRVMVKQGANIQVTEESLENDNVMRGRVDGKMLGNLRRYMEWNIFNGTATGLSSTDRQNLVGLRNSTDINVLDGTGKDLYNAVNEAIDMVDLNGNADVSAILLHRKQWSKWKGSQTNTGAFIHGDPSQPVTMAIDGIPVVITNVLPEGEVFVGAWASETALYYMRNAEVKMIQAQRSPSGGGITTPTGVVNIFTDVRYLLGVFQPKGITKITGLTL